jgi:UDP-3-O-[3-hydroxymyristoyl] glucosamine N-acyltransferase
LKASELARAIGGQYEGGADPEITGAAPLDYAGPADITILASPRYADAAQSTAAGLVLVTEELAPRLRADTPRILVRDVHATLAALLPVLYPATPTAPGIHPTAVLERDVKLGADVSIGAYAVVGAGSEIAEGAVLSAHVVLGRGCRIGAGTYLHPHVVLYDRVSVGARSILHTGVRVGVDGFGYTHRDGRHVKVPQVGGCNIGDDVEIGANTCIDRGSIGDTTIGNGCKIDNLVHIGHNVRIGDHAIIVAQVGISGSTRAGRYVTFGGQAGIGGHLTIGDGATIGAQSGVMGSVAAGETVSGYPARPHREAMRAYGGLFKLPAVIKRLRALERAVFGKDSDE